MKALIFGATGQDGSYLSELLLEKGYEVIGVSRRVSVDTTERIRHLQGNPNFQLAVGDVTDAALVGKLILMYKPSEVYNLAAQSHVGVSFSNPVSTFDINAVGTINILEALHIHAPNARFYQASTSEMFGSNFTTGICGTDIADKMVDPATSFKHVKFQDENTPLSPNSPYAISKVAAHDAVRVYRESYGLHASSGILFNHESERRGDKFVTRKITRYVAALYLWRNVPNRCHSELEILSERLEATMSNKTKTGFPKLRLGNVDAHRDWGHAEDYVRAMWLMLQQPVPDDYVIGTGETRSVRDFLNAAFKAIGEYDYEDYFVIDEAFYRPCEVEFLNSNPAKAKEKLGWEPEISFDELVKRMVWADIERWKARHERELHDFKNGVGLDVQDDYQV